LGNDQAVDSLEIRWPGGAKEVVESPGRGRVVVLEGAGRLIGRF
jgi:hypothetical protein